MMPAVAEQDSIQQINIRICVPEMINIHRQAKQSVSVVQRLNGFGEVLIKYVLPVMMQIIIAVLHKQNVIGVQIVSIAQRIIIVVTVIRLIIGVI